MATSSPDATLDDILDYAFVIDKTGKVISEVLPIEFLTRHDEWEPRNGSADQFITLPHRESVKDGLLGLAVGDALGVPVEFLDREKVREINITEMVGAEDKLPFRSRWGQMIPAGAWSDDTSMTIAAMDAIIKDKGKINYDHIMSAFRDWWYGNKHTSIGTPFGLGGVVGEALHNYMCGVPALECGGTGLGDNGNGSLMRILPFSLYCIEKDLSEEETVAFIGEASSITHAHEISKMACFIYTEFLRYLVMTRNPKISQLHICNIDYSKYYAEKTIEEFARLIGRGFLFMDGDSIPEKNGYVVPTLESAIYAVAKTDSYEDALRMAIGFGYDTDTVGAVAGSLAGVLYGYEGIPERWLAKLKKREELIDLAAAYNEAIRED